MLLKITKSFIAVMILCGLVFTVLNFVPNAWAPAIWGTITYVPPELRDQYDPEREIFPGGLYCLDDESNCCIVF